MERTLLADDEKPFLVVRFKKLVKVSGFKIDPFRIGKFTLDFSVDGTTWKLYKDDEPFSPAQVKLFTVALCYILLLVSQLESSFC
jgi:hypothetical protein